MLSAFCHGVWIRFLCIVKHTPLQSSVLSCLYDHFFSRKKEKLNGNWSSVKMRMDNTYIRRRRKWYVKTFGYIFPISNYRLSARNFPFQLIYQWSKQNRVSDESLQMIIVSWLFNEELGVKIQTRSNDHSSCSSFQLPQIGTKTTLTASVDTRFNR